MNHMKITIQEPERYERELCSKDTKARQDFTTRDQSVLQHVGRKEGRTHV